VIGVVTDSAASLPRELTSELGIEVVPMYLRLGGRDYRDGVDVEDFYGTLRREGTVVTTSAPAPGDFVEAFDRTGAEEIVCITIASSLSGFHDSARVASDNTDKNVVVVDSGSASLGEGFSVIEAARAAREGADLETVAGRARDVAERSWLFGAIDTFEFLRKSGRVKALQAYAATMLRIKPVFRLRGGVIDPVARPRTMARAIDRMIEESVVEIGSRPAHVGAVHADAEEKARALLDRLASRVEVVESLVSEFTPGMGAHTGPGLVGVAFYCD
jgi:DegV family protein with EDD domain